MCHIIVAEILLLPNMPQQTDIDERIAAPDALSVDRALGACLLAKDDEQWSTQLGDLIAVHIQPLIERVVSARLRRHDAAALAEHDDIASDALVSFLLYVEDLRKGTQEPPHNLGAFVHTLAARACSDHFRRMHPAFHRLRNKLRYLLETYPEFARWKDAQTDEWVCGLAAWQHNGTRPRSIVTLAQAAHVGHPADQLTAVFRSIGAQVRFDDLVQHMARQWNVQEMVAEPMEQRDGEETGHFDPIDSAPPVGMALERRQWLTQLWAQIVDLNLKQRTALLLNLRNLDGSSAAVLFVITGIATLRQMAALLQMEPARFAEMWQRLPLNDRDVAELLDMTRQQVINLRKCARERLARHMNLVDRRRW